MFHEKPLEERKATYQKEINKHSYSCPIIIELLDNQNEPTYTKIIVPERMGIAELRIKLNGVHKLTKKDQTSALVSKKSNVLINNNLTVKDVYEK